MPEAAKFKAKRHVFWARPDGRHDRLVRFLGWVLPVLVGILIAVLALAPLWNQQESSFVLQKTGLTKAKEPLLAVDSAYRGEDKDGRPFILKSNRAVQVSTGEPLVALQGLSGQMAMRDGVAQIESESSLYNTKTRDLAFPGAVQFIFGDKYRLNANNVTIDLNTKRGYSNGPVTGSVPIALFSANHMTMDLESRIVVLEGRARGRIVQGALKKK